MFLKIFAFFFVPPLAECPSRPSRDGQAFYEAWRAPFLTRRILHFCGLFTKKYGLIFKGSAASPPTHSPRQQFTLSAVEGLGLRPRLCFARAIFVSLLLDQQANILASS